MNIQFLEAMKQGLHRPPTRVRQKYTPAAPCGAMDAPSFSASWIQQDRAYLAHHFQCQDCIAGGQGRGKRCETGAGLWAAYTKASMQGAR